LSATAQFMVVVATGVGLSVVLVALGSKGSISADTFFSLFQLTIAALTAFMGRWMIVHPPNAESRGLSGLVGLWRRLVGWFAVALSVAIAASTVASLAQIV
jgi:hypothetical protein